MITVIFSINYTTAGMTIDDILKKEIGPNVMNDGNDLEIFSGHHCPADSDIST